MSFLAVMSYFEENKADSIRLNLEESRTFFQQSAMLMAPAIVSLSHTGRKSVLSNLTDEKYAKVLLKNQYAVLEREHLYMSF